jgi:hypothetical protein
MRGLNEIHETNENPQHRRDEHFGELLFAALISDLLASAKPKIAPSTQESIHSAIEAALNGARTAKQHSETHKG